MIDAGEKGSGARIAGHEEMDADMPGYAAGVEVVYTIVFRFQVVWLDGLCEEVDVVGVAFLKGAGSGGRFDGFRLCTGSGEVGGVGLFAGCADLARRCG